MLVGGFLADSTCRIGGSLSVSEIPLAGWLAGWPEKQTSARKKPRNIEGKPPEPVAEVSMITYMLHGSSLFSSFASSLVPFVTF